jgi:Kef-type K+ transport system membrane component KefB
MMPDIFLTGLVVVATIAFLAPLVLGLAPPLRVPSVVVEIVAGIVIGPAVLGVVEVNLPLQVMALLGLAFLLLLARLEIDLDRLRGGRLRSAAAGFVVSLAIALGIGLGLYGAGLIEALLLVTIILSSTSLGIVIPGRQEFRELMTSYASSEIIATPRTDQKIRACRTVVLNPVHRRGQDRRKVRSDRVRTGDDYPPIRRRWIVGRRPGQIRHAR